MGAAQLRLCLGRGESGAGMMRLSHCWRGLREAGAEQQLEAMQGDGWRRRRDCSEGGWGRVLIWTDEKPHPSSRP